jgi:hypothetical protein
VGPLFAYFNDRSVEQVELWGYFRFSLIGPMSDWGYFTENKIGLIANSLVFIYGYVLIAIAVFAVIDLVSSKTRLTPGGLPPFSKSDVPTNFSVLIAILSVGATIEYFLVGPLFSFFFYRSVGVDSGLWWSYKYALIGPMTDWNFWSTQGLRLISFFLDWVAGYVLVAIAVFAIIDLVSSKVKLTSSEFSSLSKLEQPLSNPVRPSPITYQHTEFVGRQTGTKQAPKVSDSANLISDLEKLSGLLDRGLLTKEEFQEAKRRLLSN